MYTNMYTLFKYYGDDGFAQFCEGCTSMNNSCTTKNEISQNYLPLTTFHIIIPKIPDRITLKKSPMPIAVKFVIYY